MKSRDAILFVVGAILVATIPASAVPANPIDATVVTLLPADGTPAALRKMTTAFASAIAKANNDANTKRHQLRQHLVEGFDRAIAQAQTTGDLDMVLTLKEAKDQFDSLEDSEISLVKNAIAFREKKTAEIESSRVAEALKAAKTFNDELEKAKKAETQKGSIALAKAFSDHQKKVLEWAKTLQANVVVPQSNPKPVQEPVSQENKALPGLSISYYDIPNTGYAEWICSEQEARKYFRSRTSSMKTTTEAFGSGLTTGHSDERDPLTRKELKAIANAGMVPMESGVCRLHGKYGRASAERFATLMSGKLKISDGGLYDFAAVADDDIVLYIDGSRVLNAQWFAVARGSKFLSAGDHSILIAIYENTGEQGFTIQWKQPGTSSFIPIPQSVLFHDPSE